mmetsp:Transcript_19991/g.38397  ORF Transcript_19991/g.38397 Transcript_19991/m.38397 type:complete len:103 (+) Transcript_19991:1-309(+)
MRRMWRRKRKRMMTQVATWLDGILGIHHGKDCQRADQQSELNKKNPFKPWLTGSAGGHRDGSPVMWLHRVFAMACGKYSRQCNFRRPWEKGCNACVKYHFNT